MDCNDIGTKYEADSISDHLNLSQNCRKVSHFVQISFQSISNHYKPFQLCRFHSNPFHSITMHFNLSKTASGPHAGPLLISPTNLDTRKVPPSITFCLKCICNGLEWVEMIFKRKFDPKAHPPPLGCKFDLWNSLNWKTLTTICKWDFNSFQSISIAISLQFISNHYNPFQIKLKVRVRGKVNLAISRKRSVVEQNGIKIWTLWVKRGIEEACGGVSEKKDKVTLSTPKIKPPF